VLAAGPKRRGFKPDRSDSLNSDKNPQYTFIRTGSKAGGSMSEDFTAGKKTLRSMIGMLRQENSRTFLATYLSHC
jgi:hypothetical protein